MTTLSDLQFLVRAGRSASLSAAARAAGVSPAAASARLKRLEAGLGVRLFVRSTRSLRLTEEGRQYLQQCEQALETITQAGEALRAGHGQIRGQVQLAMPSDLGRQQVLAWLHEFRRLHPGVALRLQVSDRVAAIHREPVDVALRYGEPADSTLIALPLAPDNRRVLCAAPGYLAEHGHPASPLDLPRHRCLCFMLGERPHDRWRFWRDGQAVTVRVDSAVQCDDGDAVRRLACLGEGIAYKSRLDVADDLRRGTLVALCPDWLGEPAPLTLTCADRSALRPVVRLLREHLVARLAGLAAAPGALTSGNAPESAPA